MLRALLVLVVAACASALGCARPESETNLTEVARSRVGDIDVVLLTSKPAIAQGRDNLTFEFRRTDGTRVDVGTVSATATMPMAGMPPMFGGIQIQRTQTPGLYTATSDLGMAGEWRVGVEWNGPAGRGSVTFTTSAQ